MLQIGNWCTTQRQNFKKGKLTEEKTDLLKDIDYTVSGTTSVVLTTGANAGDDLVITNISSGSTGNYIIAGQANFKDYKYRATAGQTAFTGNDLNSQSLSVNAV